MRRWTCGWRWILNETWRGVCAHLLLLLLLLLNFLASVFNPFRYGMANREPNKSRQDTGYQAEHLFNFSTSASYKFTWFFCVVLVLARPTDSEVLTASFCFCFCLPETLRNQNRQTEKERKREREFLKTRALLEFKILNFEFGWAFWRERASKVKSQTNMIWGVGGLY